MSAHKNTICKGFFHLFVKVSTLTNKQTRTRNWGPPITSMRPFSDLSLLSSFHVPFCDHDPHLAPFSAEKNAFFCDFLAVNSDVSAALKRTSFQLFRQRGRKTIFWQFPTKHNNVKVMIFCYQNFSALLWEKNVLVITFEIRGWRPRICKIFEVTTTIYSNSERPEQFLVTQCFFNLFLEVSHI